MAFRVIWPSPLSRNSNKLRRSWYSSSNWLIQNFNFGDFTSFANLNGRKCTDGPFSALGRRLCVWFVFEPFGDSVPLCFTVWKGGVAWVRGFAKPLQKLCQWFFGARLLLQLSAASNTKQKKRTLSNGVSPCT